MIISLENGKYFSWRGIIKESSFIDDKKYLIYNMEKILKFTIDKRVLLIKNKEAILYSIKDLNKEEQEHAKITESKYRQLIVSTITHDLKSTISAIIGNLNVLKDHINEKSDKYFKAAQISAMKFEYYIYDITVYLYRI